MVEVGISLVLLIILFITMLVLIAKDVMDRSALVLIFALIDFFILIGIDHKSPLIFVEFIIGTMGDEFVNFRTLALIFGIMVISTVCQRTGLFQFIAFKMIQFTKGVPMKVMFVIGILTFFVSSVLADSITAIILIPLTITVCRTLKMNPVPYLIVQAIFIKLGATVLPISSVSSILITAAQEISFSEYFLTSGLVSITVAILSLIVLAVFYRKTLNIKAVDGLQIFIQYNAWIFVKDRKMMLKATLIFLLVILCFILIPSDILKPDAIALTGAALILFLNRNECAEILKELDFSLILYLMSVFVITGSLQEVGLIDLIGESLTNVGPIDIGFAFLLLLWIGAIASAFIDNIPITQLLLSLINLIMGVKGTPSAKFGSMGLALGVIWGDNFTPFGDSILALSIAKKNGITIQPTEFFKVGAPLTLFQLSMVSLFVFLIYLPLVGIPIFIILGIFLAVKFVPVYVKYMRNKPKSKKIHKKQQIDEIEQDSDEKTK